MDYDHSDSVAGTAGDLPPSHQNRIARVRRSADVSALSYPRVHNEMENLIHQLEQEAYSFVLRAFKAQSDAITWEKESMITELRKELRVSNDEHRELLGKVNADNIIQRIREWREAGGIKSGMLSASQPVDDAIPSPKVSGSLKRQNTSQSVPSLSLGVPSPALHHQALAAPRQPSPSVAKIEADIGTRVKKPKPGQTLADVSRIKPMQCPSTDPSGRGQVQNRSSFGAVAPSKPAEAATLIGKKVSTRWPADKNFYEALITNYNPVDGRYALVYDINTENETWEWVNLAEVPDEDIKWEGEDPGISCRVGYGGPGHGTNKSAASGSAIPGSGRVRGDPKNQSKKEAVPSQNDIGKEDSDDIEILHTHTLLKKVERVFSANQPNPIMLEKAKRLLNEHEQTLIDAIDRIVDSFADESEETGSPISYGQSMGQERERNQERKGGNRHAAALDDDGMAGKGKS